MNDIVDGPHIAIIGGGITGLAAAHRLVTSSPSLNVTVLEASPSPGGLIRTESHDGFLIENGPDSFITNKPSAVEFCDELGIGDQLIPTNAEFRRSLVLHNGQPEPVPDGFMLMAPGNLSAILKTPILSLSGKLRLLGERFIGARQSEDDESLANFVIRRFGRETFDRLVQPLVGGIYTADPWKLSLKATLPRFIEMERAFGSIIKAAIHEQKESQRKTSDDSASSGSGARYGLFATHRDGLTAIIDACVRSCEQTGRVAVQCGQRVETIRPVEGNGCQWHLRTRGRSTAQVFDAVIVTLPTHAAVKLLPDPRFDALRSALEPFEYASTAIIVSGHRLTDFTHPMDAFGMVVPETEGRNILAVSFASRKFADRAPDGSVLLRTFVGGAMHQELLEADDAQLNTMVEGELKSLLGMHEKPLFSTTARFNNAMPQYQVGHMERVQRVATQVEPFSGLHLAGSVYDGVGLPDSIRSGRTAADRILRETNGSQR
jgi:protoporphyrinogen/coproporphyrinogen III oxidase